MVLFFKFESYYDMVVSCFHDINSNTNFYRIRTLLLLLTLDYISTIILLFKYDLILHLQYDFDRFLF